MVKKTIGRQELRSFGLIVAAGFAVIALAPLVFRTHEIRTWALGVALPLAAAALAFPQILKPLYRIWMSIGEALGWVNTRVILTVTYYALIVPTGAILRMAGKDPMRRKGDPQAGTYRIPRTKRPASHMQHQY